MMTRKKSMRADLRARTTQAVFSIFVEACSAVVDLRSSVKSAVALALGSLCPLCLCGENVRATLLSFTIEHA